MSSRKYHNTKTVIDGITFDSKKEAKYWLYLRQEEDEGRISDLRRQVSFEVIPAVYKDVTVVMKTKTKIVKKCVQKAAHYVADFVYNDSCGNERVVDVKSPITRRNPEYRLKKKMMLAFLGIDVIEV